MKTYMITYGDERYQNQRQFLKQMAQASGFFNDVRVFEPKDLDPLFKLNFSSILSQPRGGGYWIWKPYLVARTLSVLNDGDVLVYCDAGCEINPKGSSRFRQYIAQVKDSETGSLAFELPHKEIEYTKREVFDYFNVTPDIVASDQLMATVLILEKCEHTAFIVDRWLETLRDKPALFTDEGNALIQYPQFIDHRHDQSIFSVIRKMYGTEIIQDDTYFLDFYRDGLHSPIWAARKRG